MKSDMLTPLLLTAAVLLSSPADGRQTRSDPTCIDASRICKKITDIAASLPANRSLESAIPRECVRMDIARRQANFAIDLLRSINSAQPGVSAIVSPFWIAITLAALSSGANGETLAELQAAVAGPRVPPSAIHDYFSGLVRDIQAQNKGLKATQLIYVAKNAAIKQDFLNSVKRNYAASSINVDFRKRDEAAEVMNENMLDATEGRIRKAISAEDFDSKSRLVLINTIFFKAPWVYEFTKYPKKIPFKISADKSVTIGYMTRSDSLIDYYSDADVSCVAFRLVGADMVAYFILPQETFGLDSFLGKFNAKRFEKIRYGLRERYVSATVPKFDLMSDLDLKALLRDKFPTAFSDNAEFHGISDEPLGVDRFRQLAKLEVNEQGVVAAAATVDIAAADTIMSNPIRFIADHPFLFLLADGTGTIDFAATVLGETFKP